MPTENRSKWTHLIFPILSGITLAALIGESIILSEVRKDLNGVASGYDELKESQKAVEERLPELFYSDHLNIIQKDKLEFLNAELQKQVSSSSGQSDDLQKINQIYTLVDDFQKKLSRNSEVKIDVSGSGDKLEVWGALLINKDYQKVTDSISADIKSLDEAYNKYLAALPPPPAVSGGYSSSTVKTEKGTTHTVYVIKKSLSEVEVKTVAAVSGDCSKDCPTKSLEEYIKQSGGFAGMNGTYFCPPDYSECSNKVNSFDYALYDSQDKKWINKEALSWSKTGLMTFKGSSVSFYKESTGYDGDGVTAGLSNYPSLLNDGKVVVRDGDLTSYQKVRGLRGVIGTGGGNVYLVQISAATIEEAAYVMKSLGAEDALNLDGGGSSALYIDGKYILGPGRSLANAVVLVAK